MSIKSTSTDLSGLCIDEQITSRGFVHVEGDLHSVWVTDLLRENDDVQLIKSKCVLWFVDLGIAKNSRSERRHKGNQHAFNFVRRLLIYANSLFNHRMQSMWNQTEVWSRN